MDDIIQIKCPFDGAILSVKNQPGIESKNVTCPICKHKYPFTQFKRVDKTVNTGDDPDTEYPGGNGHNDEATDLGQLNFTIGRLKVSGAGTTFRLKPGRNVIGRKATKSGADFQIDTGEQRAMSREHIVVEVKKVPAKGFVHYLSLFKEKVNKTWLGNEQLLFGDVIVLNHGDIIKLPDATLIFEIPDDEATDY
ncbi:MAG: FHA domain-containing protein [Bacteroidales bacterium]|nr:FHA domain-containing protein [Bacteroidales bacterium]MBD5284503.1 FHA domain-containing protein [Bacteroides sp.]